ncbi:class II aldolase/adducin family protein [Caminibacter sp.]
MVIQTILDEYNLVAQELFKKNFLSIGLGSISLKLKADQMIINKKNKHYSEEDFYKRLHILREDMAWEEASEDVKIHAQIYRENSTIKSIAHIISLNVLTYAEIHHNSLNPIDFIGKTHLGKVPIIEIGNLQEWDENKEFIIARNLKKANVLIIKGLGIYIQTRDIREIIKTAVILDNSASILLNSHL